MGPAAPVEEALQAVRQEVYANLSPIPQEAVDFINSAGNPYACVLSKTWPSSDPGTPFSNSFVSFRYPPSCWNVYADGLDVHVTAPDIGVNMILWVAALPSPMSAQQIFESSIDPSMADAGELEEPRWFEVGQPATQFWGGKRVVQVQGPHPSGVMVMVRNKEMNLYHTTVEEDTCVCYNCSLFAGEGLWMKFEPLFDRFLSTLHFRDHKVVYAVCMAEANAELQRGSSRTFSPRQPLSLPPAITST